MDKHVISNSIYKFWSRLLIIQEVDKSSMLVMQFNKENAIETTANFAQVTAYYFHLTL